MSAARTCRRLVRLYPVAWRARYGEELEALIAEASAGDPIPWRMRFDLALAAAREHAHELRTGGVGRAPQERVRAGAVLVLWAWMLFVLAGINVQKLSEHWQDSVGEAHRTLPSAAFDGLVAGAAIATAIVVIGAALLLPSLIAFGRDGRLGEIRRSTARSAALTLLTAFAAVVVVAWAHQLTARQRNGGDAAYAVAAVAFALLGALCLASWVATASALTRRLELPVRTLRLEALVALALVIAMAAMTLCTVVWWVAVADAPQPSVAPAVVLMLIAVALGATGSTRAVRSSASARTPSS
jgi:hypothetical protein